MAKQSVIHLSIFLLILGLGLYLVSCDSAGQEAPDVAAGDLSCVPGNLLNLAVRRMIRVELKRSASADLQYTFKISAQPIPAKLDVVFLMDRSNRMQQEIDDLAVGFKHIVAQISAMANVREPAFAVTSFKDFSCCGGAASDYPFRLEQAISTDQQAVQEALNAIADDVAGGGDTPESAAEALFQVATGAGYDHNKDADYNDKNDIVPYDTSLSTVGDLGGVGFRSDATKVVMLSTDAWFKDPTTGNTSPPSVSAPTDSATKQMTISALKTLSILVVGLGSQQNVEAFGPFADLTLLAEATGAFKADHAPMLYQVNKDGSNVASQIVAGLNEIADQIRLKLVVTLPEGFTLSIDSQERYMVSGSDAVFSIGLQNESALARCYDQYFTVDVKLVQLNADGSQAAEIGSRVLGIIVPAVTIN